MCPPTMRNETDFLCSMDSVDVHTNLISPIAPYKVTRHVTVSPMFLDEDKIWDYYEELPGNVILLRDKPANTW